VRDKAFSYGKILLKQKTHQGAHALPDFAFQRTGEQ
jgi:hypothetical protein